VESGCSISEKGGELLIAAGDGTRPTARIAVTFLATTACTIVIGYRYLALEALIPLALALGTLAATPLLRRRYSQLQITRLELTTIGFLQDGTVPPIPLTDVLRLEYRTLVEEGPDSPEQPEGVYVETRYGTKCMLTFVNESEANHVIDAIYQHFPEIPSEVPENRSLLFADDTIRLNLDR
jgi:hypothetical protein